VVAAHNRKKPSGIWKFSFFYILYPGAIYANRHIVLGFACNGTCMAADAFSVVDNKTKFHNFPIYKAKWGGEIITWSNFYLFYKNYNNKTTNSL